MLHVASLSVTVGGGTAGCVVATRLSEDPGTKVLLLEAGDDGTDIRLRVPIFGAGEVNGTRDWKYSTVKQEKACLGLKGDVSWLILQERVSERGMHERERILY
jgi:choline dehydrogenase-like flavoprotein